MAKQVVFTLALVTGLVLVFLSIGAADTELCDYLQGNDNDWIVTGRANRVRVSIGISKALRRSLHHEVNPQLPFLLRCLKIFSKVRMFEAIIVVQHD